MPTPFSVFGPGSLYLTRTDITTATPINIGYAQELDIDISYTVKDLYGQNQFPLDSARSVAKVTGKAKAAVVSGIAMNEAFFGQSFSSGTLLSALPELHTIPGTPYQVTVTNSGEFDVDLGVVYTATNLPLQKVASSPATGQYAEAGGVYTFAAADTTLAVSINYTYANSSAGQTLAINNTLIGTTPTFQLDYATTHLNKTMVVRVYQAIGSKLSWQFKLEDFMIPELDFNVFANAAGQVFLIAFPEVS